MAARNPAGTKRAAAYVLQEMGAAGMDSLALIDRASVDPSTLRTFLDGETYPQTKVRTRIETALGVSIGTIDLAYRGMLNKGAEDSVERAIEASSLTRANKLRLLAQYVDMLESQQGRGAG